MVLDTCPRPGEKSVGRHLPPSDPLIHIKYIKNLPREGRVNGTIVSLGIQEGASLLGNRPVLKGQGFNPPRGSTERKEGKVMRFEIALER